MNRFLCPVLMAWALLAGCDTTRNDAPDTEEQALIARGEILFVEHCDGCHPRSGRGDYLKRIPATLLTRRSASELVDWIGGSDKHREMPNFTRLSDGEKQALAAYLMSQGPSR